MICFSGHFWRKSRKQIPYILLISKEHHKKTDLNKWHKYVTEKLKQNLKADHELKSQVIIFCEIKKQRS